MSDLKTFADRVAKAATRADFLRAAIAWMEKNDQTEILREPLITINQQWGSGTEGYGPAMHLISVKILRVIEETAKDTLADARKELAEIEETFSRFTEQENTP
ncbi:MAG: hypothetical protein DI537_38315 [Stutzerimonas stutzeri]|nr:MAG: hypothetical protein DI537_38315 [Stutzerimonas stutzeri]